MPNLISLFVQTVLSPLLLFGFLIVVLFALAGLDGLPVAKALLVLIVNIAVSICAWFARVLLTLLTLLIPALSPILQPGGSKPKGKSK
jgi:hypothetical protein